MSVRQVLNHASGLYDYIKGEGWSPTDGAATNYSPDQLFVRGL